MPLPSRTTTRTATAAFIADANSIDRNQGRQIDWANVTAGAGVVPALNSAGKKWLRAGTAVGELLGTGKVSPRVVTTNPAIGFLETDAVEDDLQDAATGYGVIVGGVLFENLLPDSSGGPPKTLPAAIKTEVQTAGVGTGFAFQEYADVR